MVTLFACLNCRISTHRDYGFSEHIYRLNKADLHAKLRGYSESFDRKVSVTHAPYELLIWFESPSRNIQESCSVTLDLVTWKDAESGKTTTLTESSTALFRKKHNGELLAYFSFKNLYLSYANHEVNFAYTFGQTCDSDLMADSVSVFFEKKYSERKITLWDVMMGV